MFYYKIYHLLLSFPIKFLVYWIHFQLKILINEHIIQNINNIQLLEYLYLSIADKFVRDLILEINFLIFLHQL